MLQNSIPNKGRSVYHIQRRNKRLAARFYWYSCIIGLKFSKCLELLDQEFEITESRICDLLSENAETVSQLEQNNIDVQQLKQLYPFMKWQYLPATRSQNAVQLSLDLFSGSGLSRSSG